MVSDAQRQVPTSGRVLGVVMDRDVAVPMSDGVQLMVNVFRPESDGRRPVILSVSPYGKDDLPQRWRSGRPGMDFGIVQVSEYAAFEAPDPGFWVPAGYVVVHGNVRGTWNSEGTSQWLSPQDARDYAELIEWAATQPFSDGNVGLCGVSYLAMSQWAVAALNPPHLKAIIPWEGASDQYREFVYQGGLRETKFFPSFYEYRLRASQNPRLSGEPRPRGRVETASARRRVLGGHAARPECGRGTRARLRLLVRPGDAHSRVDRGI